ncbi:MAG: energy transducer TonB [Bacteroidia bacterium]|nr:energy transducer TonB [Bacteroidia bacterium]
MKYPSEAAAKGSQGRVNVALSIELDGSISNIKTVGSPDPILADAVKKVIESSPKWDPPKNPDVDEAYKYYVTLKFTLPDKVSDGKAYLVVEQMPEYPGGDVELLNFIKNNTKYPEQAKDEKIEGRVIIRFIINPEGNIEDPVVIKGINPILDAEALRVVGLLKFQPGMQGGRAVSVYYMVPVNFSLPKENMLK